MAVTKDYYKILNVRSTASVGEIKNAYRKLAMKYHPDRNPDDALAAAVFTEVAEAYNILSDVDARKKYNYERTLTAAEEYEKPVETIDTLIQRIKKINGQIKAADPFRLNKDALLYSIRQLLPTDITMISNSNAELTNEFLQLVCESANYLSSNQLHQLMLLLQPLDKKHPSVQQQLHQLLSKQQKAEQWERNKIVLAVLLALILCIIIFFAARS